MKPTYSPDQLQVLVAPHLNTSANRPHFTPIGTGKHNQSFFITQGDAAYVLRISPPDDAGFLFYEVRMMRQEPALHHLIRERTSIPVAEIIAADFSRTKIDRDFVLMQALPGYPVSEAPMTRSQFSGVLFQVGQHLRELHSLTALECLGKTAFGYLGEHQPMPAQPTWQAAFELMWNRLLDDVVACGAYTPAEAQFMRTLLAQHQSHFEHEVHPRLLHMDVWSQNILVDQVGDVTGLVDFDRALWGDVEIEFAVLDYCGISEPSFWKGYGKQRDTTPSAMIRRQFYLLYEIQKYMPIRIWRRTDPEGAHRYKQQSFQLAAALIQDE